jgi:hypothetical protein
VSHAAETKPATRVVVGTAQTAGPLRMQIARDHDRATDNGVLQARERGQEVNKIVPVLTLSGRDQERTRRAITRMKGILNGAKTGKNANFSHVMAQFEDHQPCWFQVGIRCTFAEGEDGALAFSLCLGCNADGITGMIATGSVALEHEGNTDKQGIVVVTLPDLLVRDLVAFGLYACFVAQSRDTPAAPPTGRVN